MKIMKASLTTITVSFLAISCASWHQAQSPAQVIWLNHVHGNRYTCLSNCVDMVLDYYGLSMYFANQPGEARPANLLAMDSLIHSMAPAGTTDPYQIHSFVLQTDEKFLQEQLARQRPVILIYKSGKEMYHSVVVSGVTADRRSYFVDDPAKSKPRWVSRGQLVRRWKTTGNTAMLVAIAPAGT